jgi:hypothetical protein
MNWQTVMSALSTAIALSAREVRGFAHSEWTKISDALACPQQ